MGLVVKLSTDLSHCLSTAALGRGWRYGKVKHDDDTEPDYVLIDQTGEVLYIWEGHNPALSELLEVCRGLS